MNLLHLLPALALFGFSMGDGSTDLSPCGGYGAVEMRRAFAASLVCPPFSGEQDMVVLPLIALRLDFGGFVLPSPTETALEISFTLPSKGAVF
jgi:hypothetical protein